MSVRNLGASVRDRLLNKARAEKLDYNLVLTRYALERMLYRLSISKQRDQFLLKGALLGMLDSARCPVQIDIGFGDAVVPGPDEVDYPVILGEMPGPHLHVYPRYTVVAEKLEALTSLGMLNSRMKDFFDLWILSKHSDFDGQILSRAVAATFDRRHTAVPNGVPIGLSDEFISDAQKSKQWLVFLRKNALAPMPLATVVADLRDFLMPVLTTIAAGGSHDYSWRAGAGWQTP